MTLLEPLTYDLTAPSPRARSARLSDLALVATPLAAAVRFPELLGQLTAAAEIAENALAKNTTRAYRGHLAAYDDWCDRIGVPAVPVDPELFALHLVSIAATIGDDERLACDRYGDPLPGPVRPQTAAQRLAAVNRACRANSLPAPGDNQLVKDVMRGLKNTFGVLPARKHAADLDVLVRLLEAARRPRPSQIRDAAIIAVRAVYPSASQLTALAWDSIFDDPALSADARDLLRAHHIAAGAPGSGPVFVMSRQGIAKVLSRFGPARDADAVAATVALVLATPRQLRDAAWLLMGWYAALRRSNVVGARWADVTITDDWVHLVLTRSKCNPDGSEDEQNWLPANENPDLCPVRALVAWRDRLTDALGRPLDPAEPVFCPVDRHGNPRQLGGELRRASGRAVASSVQEHAAAAGLDPTKFGAHSLRAGWITEAANNGLTIDRIQANTHQKTLEVIMRYVRNADRRHNNPIVELFAKRSASRG